MRTYTSGEIQRLAKVTKRQLIHWVESRAIVPHVDDRRRGGTRIFSQQNLLEALVCRELNHFNLPVFLFRVLMTGLRTLNFWQALPAQEEIPFLVYPSSPWPEQETFGISVAFTRKPPTLEERLTAWPSAIVVNLPALVAEAGGLRDL